MRQYIHESNLIKESEDDDCLLKFVHNEMTDLDNNINRLYKKEVLQSFWRTIEEELFTCFKAKVERNMQKNKPERFKRFEGVLPVLINLKQSMFDADALQSLDLDVLKTMQSEMQILIDSSPNLIKKVLRQKAENQFVELDENDNSSKMDSSTSIGIKLAYLRNSDELVLELVNIH